ncbi:glycosyltransferase [Lentibacillus salinarum]|uniref:Glycosyltransferase n=1 Tax=Lentibacillus salinarum TaxID=446820 RepID=A0ABW3ZWD6_9BACI
MTNKNYSVLMSVYQKETPEYFITSIESMINQTLPPNEIVIVKDGELTEELDEVINRYQTSYPNLFTVVPLQHNVGLGKALNYGLENCKNELVARMDTDDISVRDRCELQINKFVKNDNLSIVGSFIDEFYDDPENILSSRVVPITHQDILKFSRRRNPFNHPTVMYKKSAVLRCGGYGDYRRNQDFDLFVRMLNSGFIAENVDKALVLFRANQNNSERRKSWVKCKSNIKLMHTFWKKGYSSLIDLLIVSVSQLVVYISPLWFFNWLSNTFLRKTPNNQES